jgi:hypothetical protein
MNARLPNARQRRWEPNAGRNNNNNNNNRPHGAQNAQRSYERYLALAEAEVLAGNIIGAENYFQHAEHYFRSMANPGNS